MSELEPDVQQQTEPADSWSTGEGAGERLSWQTAVGFAAVALLLAWPTDAVEAALGDLHFATSSLLHLLAVVLLLPVFLVARSKRWPGIRGWEALLLLVVLARTQSLLLQPWFEVEIPHIGQLRALSSARLLLVEFAAPLWLAALASLQWVPERVPRMLIGCALGTVAAACFMLSDNQLSLSLNEAPVLILGVALSIGTVWSWSFARSQLRGVSPVAAAMGAALLYAAVDGALSLATEHALWQPVDWWASWLPLAVGGVRTAVAAALWYWLLRRMRLAAFAMMTAAVWLANMLSGLILYGSLGWRWNIAFLLGLISIVVALRARDDDDQPVSLGLP